MDFSTDNLLQKIVTPPLVEENDNYLLKFAETPEEIRAAQKLRYKVFNCEQNRGLDSANRDEFDHFVADGTISGGMKPKIENALAAVERGVARVIITQPTALDGNHGTIVESSPQPSLKGSE